MEAREIIELFDSCWFEMEILKKRPILTQASSSNQNSGDQVQDEVPIPDFLGVPSIITRSISEQLSFKLNPNSAFSLSPHSVLSSPKLQTILSGKEINDQNEETSAAIVHYNIKEPGKKNSRRSRGNKGNRSKSLSELEYEELKGFMDLGFVFSEEDKDSSLVSIIPGLQRLGKNKDGEDDENSTSVPVNNEASVSRPYLSEAWEVLDRGRGRNENPLDNWRIPVSNNEIYVKDNLRWWAHAVASTVR